MSNWQNMFASNPTKALLASKNQPIVYFANRDLLTKPVAPIETLWELKIPQQILRKQQADGSWKYAGKTSWSTTDYSQFETYRQLGFLVQMFGFDRSHLAVQKAAEFFWGKQSPEGDFRGIYGAQYSPNYTAGIAELLVIAGYGDDRQMQKVFNWLLEIRQNDGGWALPLRTRGHKLEVILHRSTIKPDRIKPFSHFVTGVVLRAFAAHPNYRTSPEAKRAAGLLASRFFQKDTYPDLGKADAWTTFTYPFWNTSLMSSLDILSKLDFTKEDEHIQAAIQWLLEKQGANGLLDVHKNHDRYHDQGLWLTLAFCRMLKRLYRS